MKAEREGNARAPKPLLERYIQFIGLFLAGRQREDIVAELRANLQAEIDDGADALGRPLSESEEAALLVQHGHPIAVAGRYFPVQHLISAPWTALYWLILRQVLTIILVVSVIRMVLGAVLRHVSGMQIVDIFFDFWGEALLGFAWVTLSFMITGYFATRYRWLEDSEWDPRELPRWDVPSPERQIKPLSRLGGTVFGLGLLVALRGWTRVLPPELLGKLQFSAGWHVSYGYLLAGCLLSVLAALWVVLRPDWHVVRPIAAVIGLTLNLAGLRVLLGAAPWVWLANPAVDANRLARTLALTNVVIHWSIVGTMVGFGIALAVALWESARILGWSRPNTTTEPHLC